MGHCANLIDQASKNHTIFYRARMSFRIKRASAVVYLRVGQIPSNTCQTPEERFVWAKKAEND
jgi:hypothetical protein